MKVEVVEKKQQEQEIKFPCLMEYAYCNMVILAIGKGENGGFTGVCLDAGTADNRVGQYHDDWERYNLKPFNGSITLSND